MNKHKVSFYSQRTIEWNDKRNSVRLIDQTLLPGKLSFVECKNVDELVKAIKTMQIRGAPALGVAGAMGVALITSKEGNFKSIERKAKSLKEARPTAVNLSWGVNKALEFLKDQKEKKDYFPKVVEFAKQLADEDIETNKKLSSYGEALISDGASVLTHCN